VKNKTGLKKLPFAGEFSNVSLEWLLDEAASAKDCESLRDAIWSKYFSATAGRSPIESREREQRKRANNVLIGAKQYGILDQRTCFLTPLGQQLRASQGESMYERFAEHILRNLGGVDVLNAIRTLQRREERPSKSAIAAELERLGYELTTNSTYPAKLRSFLELAGVIDANLQINEDLVQRMLGLTTSAVETLATLTEEQKAFLRAALRVANDSFRPATEIRQYARQVLGVRLSDSLMSARIISPLVKSGFIEREGISRGRGAKSGRVRVMPRLVEEDLDHLVAADPLKAAPYLRDALRKPIGQILLDLRDSDTTKKGIALEALAVRIAQFLELEPTRWREKSSSTGGAEVDLIAQGQQLLFSRWQIQCKNTRIVTVDDLAKEHGIAVLIRSNVILLATTGSFSATAVDYARAVMRSSNLHVILLDGKALQGLRNERTGLIGLLDECRRQARSALQIKEAQLGLLGVQ